MALNTLKCNHLKPLGLKGLMDKLSNAQPDTWKHHAYHWQTVYAQELPTLNWQKCL